MAALINGYGFQMKHCTMLCWDCFYLGASSSPPWPGNHNTACDCITVTTGDADEVSAQRFSSPLYLSALLFSLHVYLYSRAPFRH